MSTKSHIHKIERIPLALGPIGGFMEISLMEGLLGVRLTIPLRTGQVKSPILREIV